MAPERRIDTTEMSTRAIEIAVSEMTGYPVEQLCTFAIVAAIHPPLNAPGLHELVIIPGAPLPQVRDILRKAAASIRRLT